MHRPWRVWMSGWRGRGLALSLLALVVQALVPAGFMVADQPGGPGLVICTGHGPLIVKSDPGHPGKAPTSHPDTPCAFRGHGAAPTPVALISGAAERIAMRPLPVQPLQDLSPGRGLAAPPPPSQGPPSLV